ncbi:MAG TPA: hypothetical protein VMB79_18230 [Jatrophihabitans sp.]|nr:hypothetical protein [Jatrophihabitans sp.]
MDEADWESARLIPVSGINGSDEQERRGSSALLAVLSSVKEFGRAVIAPLGAPSGTIETYIEVPFAFGDRNVRPDGVIRVRRGTRTWTALVEVKTGRNELKTEQLEAYLDIAREQQFDVVLTVSNQLVAIPGVHPTSVDKKKLKKVELKHLSWSQIHTEAVVQRVNRSVADPDQAWILNELIRYLEHDRSGAVDFDDMGPDWVAVRNGVTNRTLRASDVSAAEVVARFGQLIAFSAMRLSRQLGVEVRPALSRSELKDAAAFQQRAVTRLVDHGILQGSIRVPHAVAPFTVTADLRSGLVTCTLEVAAPGQGRSTTRINWLTRQLVKAPDALLIEGWAAWARTPGPCRALSEVRAKPDLLIDDPKKELKGFSVRLSAVAGTKRGQGRGSFVGSVLGLVDNFYEQVVQQIKPWTAPAPSIKGKPIDEDVDRDDISSELPLKTVQRASATPDWPAEEEVTVTDEPVYTTDVPPSAYQPAEADEQDDPPGEARE